MQINRHQPPLLTPLPTAADEQAAAQPGKQQAAPADSAPVAGVTYTASTDTQDVPDLNSLSLEDQLKLGQSLGVFKKITYSKDGQMVANPFAGHGGASADPYAGIAAPGFARGAASAMRDFEEGMNALKARAPATEAKGADFWAGSKRALQSAAARLNVFA